MKTITLLPVKNEGWILSSTLKNISDFSDHIIIADQKSTDDSLDIYKLFEKVEVIENPNKNHNNSVRWMLLDYAREKYGKENLIVCIDADEMISKTAIDEVKKIINGSNDKKIYFSFPWIQLWGTTEKHRVDTVWKNNYKAIAFFDDGIIDYERKTVLNDHTARIPLYEKNVQINQFPLLHYQYINLKQSEVKQAWYRCSELISGNKAKKINHQYSVAKKNNTIILEPTKSEWLQGLPMIKSDYLIESDWRYKEILTWFDTYGIVFFESLDIWDINELNDRFIKEINRKPKVKKYPAWLVFLNNIKNKLKNR
jgi:hypothetical protein